MARNLAASGPPDEVRRIERDLDHMRYDLEEQLLDAFSTPFDREDLYSLSRQMDYILNFASRDRSGDARLRRRSRQGHRSDGSPAPRGHPRRRRGSRRHDIRRGSRPREHPRRAGRPSTGSRTPISTAWRSSFAGPTRWRRSDAARSTITCAMAGGPFAARSTSCTVRSSD